MTDDLKRERLKRKRELACSDGDEDDQERLAESVRGLERAINALVSLDDPGLEEQMRRKEIQDARELQSIIRRYDDG